MTIENVYHALYVSTLVALSVMTLLCLVRAIRGPRIADRVVAVNMICTLTLAMICVLALMYGEGYLIDVGLVYALIGFLAVVVLCKVYMGVALERREKREQQAVENTQTEGGDAHA
ncbi:MAG: sodium:proton antiporter [Eubacteriales bacterium]|nr:sodium:proton antiporter [Eubacteriales bacterium]